MEVQLNLPLVLDGELDPRQPEIVLYAAQPNGRLTLTGADFLVLADAWDAAHPSDSPQLMGQLFQGSLIRATAVRPITRSRPGRIAVRPRRIRRSQ